jgi:hypothetical protein
MTNNKRAPAVDAAEAQHNEDTSSNRSTLVKGQLVDRYGHVHSEAVLTNWSPQALKVLGIHRIGDEPRGGE